MRVKLNRRLVKTAAVLVLIGLILVIGGAYLVVAHERPAALPAPSGTYRVGRVEHDWADTSRIDPLAAKPNTPCRLAIWIWYPASVTAGSSPAPLLPAAWQRA